MGKENFDDIAENVFSSQLSEEERKRVGAPAQADQDDRTGAEKLAAGPTRPRVNVPDAPAWLVVPPDLMIPRGRTVMFFRFPAKFTEAPTKGVLVHEPAVEEIRGADGALIREPVAAQDVLYRQCICTTLSVNDERIARARSTLSDVRYVYEEMTKQMVRAIDGRKIDGASLEVEAFWDEIGAKFRSAVMSAYIRTHQLSDGERIDFFTNHAVFRTAT